MQIAGGAVWYPIIWSEAWAAPSIPIVIEPASFDLDSSSVQQTN